MDTHIERIAYTKVEAAQALGLSLRTIDNLIAAKQLTARRIGRRVVIPTSSLLTLIRSDRSTRQQRSLNCHTSAASDETSAATNGKEEGKLPA